MSNKKPSDRLAALLARIAETDYSSKGEKAEDILAAIRGRQREEQSQLPDFVVNEEDVQTVLDDDSGYMEYLKIMGQRRVYVAYDIMQNHPNIPFRFGWRLPKKT
jgi:hypothetical protein